MRWTALISVIMMVVSLGLSPVRTLMACAGGSLVVQVRPEKVGHPCCPRTAQTRPCCEFRAELSTPPTDVTTPPDLPPIHLAYVLPPRVVLSTHCDPHPVRLEPARRAQGPPHPPDLALYLRHHALLC